MSTTFGIVIKNGELLDLPPQESGLILPQDIKDEDNIEIVDVAFRGNWPGMYWKNPIAPFLPPETKVYPLDNSHQGIYTIGDIIKELKT